VGASAILQGEQLAKRFVALDNFLLQHQPLWRPRPFTCLQLPWESEHPQLAGWLRARNLEQAEASHNQPALLAAPEPFPQLASHSLELAAIGEHAALDLSDLPARFATDVPGRKWQQVEAFASRLHFTAPVQHWLDWCAGKGHLGRLLSAHGGQPFICLERDPLLIDSGLQLSRRLNLTAQHRQQDVMASDAAEHLGAEHTAVALHACGDLHVRLLHLASAAGCRQLAVAPCCYNRISSSRYQPLSSHAQSSRLQLDTDDLRLPLTETVVAGQRIRRQRDQSMARRLAFDLLQRQTRGIDAYQPTPSMATEWLQRPFSDYCKALARHCGFTLNSPTDWDALEAAGWQRLAEVRNLELLRQLFRRPLELWLVLDRALYLQEQGYAVRLGTFCESSISPRNLLLLAERK
jgi:hypothetical protein